MNRTDFIDLPSLRGDVPDFAPGDTLKVHVKVIEGARERVQVFQGAVIRRQGSGARETFTVRKISFGVGVERTFPVHSPVIDHIEVASRGQVRRAKLYYLRDRIGKAAKIKEKRSARPSDAALKEARAERNAAKRRKSEKAAAAAVAVPETGGEEAEVEASVETVNESPESTEVENTSAE